MYKKPNSALPDAYEYLRNLSPERVSAIVNDRWAVSSTLCALREQFQSWLWTVCNRILDRQACEKNTFRRVTLIEREIAMRRALQQLVPLYPSRPERLLSSSPSVDQLRVVLFHAPRNDEDHSPTPEGIKATLDPVNDYAWTDEYLTELFEALISVIEEHGASGWRYVRWEVYDKVCCFVP